MLEDAVKLHVSMMVRMMHDAALKDDDEKLREGMLGSAQVGLVTKDSGWIALTAITPALLGESRPSRPPPDVHPC